MMKRKQFKLLALIIGILALFLVACGGDDAGAEGNGSESVDEPTEVETEEAAAEVEESGETVGPDEFVKVAQNPEGYIGSGVQFYGRVFTEPERDSDGTYLQVFADTESNHNVLVAYEDPNLDVSVDDIIYIEGTVEDIFEGENMMGGAVRAPVVFASNVEMSDYAAAFAPAIKTIDVDEELNHNGYKVELTKVELAAEETRVHVTVNNEMDTGITFYSFNAKLVSGQTQYDEQDNYQAGYTKVQSELLPDTKSEGIITFPGLPEDAESMTIHLEGSSDNYDIQIDPFVFEVSMD